MKERKIPKKERRKEREKERKGKAFNSQVSGPFINHRVNAFHETERNKKEGKKKEKQRNREKIE